MSIAYFQDMMNRTIEAYKAGGWNIEYQSINKLELSGPNNQQHTYAYLPEDSHYFTEMFHQPIVGFCVVFDGTTTYEYYVKEGNEYLGIGVSVSEDVFTLECRKLLKNWETVTLRSLSHGENEWVKKLEPAVLAFVKEKKEYRLYEVTGMIHTIKDY